jgi:hypothetical protein
MAIGPERMEFMKRTLKNAIAEYYGDRVPDLNTFKARRKKTFMLKLEEEVGATEWRLSIANAIGIKGDKQGAVTRLQNTRRSKQLELEAEQLQEIAEIKARHQLELTQLVAHYEPALLEANEALKIAEEQVKKTKRASYFAGMKTEDDGESFYQERDIEAAIKNRVEVFTEQNLGSDEEGRSVLLRVKQEDMVSQMAYIAEKLSELRGMVLKFINAGKLPPVTVEAWGIENGKDISSSVDV